MPIFIENDGSVKVNKKDYNFDYGYDGDYEKVDDVDSKINQDEKSDNSYQRTANKIVNISANQLSEQNTSKRHFQKILLVFFIILLSVQFLAIIVLVLIKGFSKNFEISDAILLTFITSVFVETLGVIAIMVKFSFNNEQETKIISILNSYIKDFKVYNSSEHGSKSNQKSE